MTQSLVVPTHYEDLAALAEGLAQRVDADQLILFGPDPFDDDAEVEFQVLLVDESVVLEGRGRAAACVDGGEERDNEYRYDIVIQALELNDRFMAVYDRILLLQDDGPSTHEHAAVQTASRSVDSTVDYEVEGVDDVVSESNAMDEAATDDMDVEGSADDMDVEGSADDDATIFESGALASDETDQHTFDDSDAGEGASEQALLGDAVSAESEAPQRFSEANAADSEAPSDDFAMDAEDGYEEPTGDEIAGESFDEEVDDLGAEPADEGIIELASEETDAEAHSSSSAPSPLARLEPGERELMPPPEAPTRPEAPETVPMGETLSRPSSAKSYSLQPDVEDTAFPSASGLFQYAKGELPPPEAPARPAEHSFRPVQPAPSLVPVSPRGSDQAFAEHLPSVQSVRPEALESVRPEAFDVDIREQDRGVNTARPIGATTAEVPAFLAEDDEIEEIESVPPEAMDDLAVAADSLAPESLAPGSLVSEEVDRASEYPSADDAADQDLPESMPPDALASDSLAPDAPEREA